MSDEPEELLRDISWIDDAIDNPELLTMMHGDTELDPLFNSADTITLTVEEVVKLMETFLAQNNSNETTDSKNGHYSPDIPEYLVQEAVPSMSSPENQLDSSDLLKSIVEKVKMTWKKKRSLANVNLKALILMTSKSLTKEDREKLISKVPPEDIINGDLRPDFFSDESTVFWKQVKELGKFIASDPFTKAKKGPTDTSTPKQRPCSTSTNNDEVTYDNVERHLDERPRRRSTRIKKM